MALVSEQWGHCVECFSRAIDKMWDHVHITYSAFQNYSSAPVLKVPRVCDTTKEGAPPSKQHHEDQGALQTGQGQSCGEVQIRVGL